MIRVESVINSALIETAPIVPHYRELLFNNQIENDLQSVLRPLNLMQTLFICSKYKIRKNTTITVNSFTYNFIGVSCMIILRVYYFYGWLSTFVGLGEGFLMLLNWSAIYDNFSCSIGFILNYYSNIKYRHKNVSLVSRIQHALTLLKVNGKEFRSLKIYSWISVISVNSVFIAIWILLFSFLPDVGYINILLSYNIIIFDINVMYASFVMKLLAKLLVIWIEDVRRAENISDSERESYWQIKYDVYVDIMEAYKLVEKTFGQLIAFNIINTACHGLINIATVLKIQILLSNDFLFGLIIFVSQIWLVKSILIGISLSVNCERFYEAMRDVWGTVTPIMYSIRCSDKHTLSACKNIQRMQNASFKNMSACGLFIVDAMMSLSLFNFITTYTIVLIQFEFL